MSEKKPRMVTPVGFAKWAHLQKPKAPFEGKGDPKYQVDICFDANNPDWKEWGTALKAAVLAVNGKNMPIKAEKNEDDSPSGRYFVTFKANEQYKPKIYDKFGDPIPENIMIGNESKIRISYNTEPYKMFGGGLAMYVNAVQVVELIEYKGGTATGYGFDVEKKDDGVVATVDPSKLPPDHPDFLPF